MWLKYRSRFTLLIQRGDESYKSVASLTEWLLPDTRTGSAMMDAKGGLHRRTGCGEPAVESSAAHEPPEVIVQHATPFDLAFDTNLNYFNWLELPENLVRLERFGHGMTGTRYWWETQREVLHGFPWAELPPDSVLVDVGGGIGPSSDQVVVVEDRIQVVEAAPSSWGPKYAPLFKSGRITFRARDMLSPWEPLTSGETPDVFLLRLVLHDWQDEDSRNILRRLRSAAGPNTKLLIGDMLLPYACESEEASVEDHSPLLPNLGVANIHGYLLDILMMALFGSKERTINEMTELALSTGWKIETVKRPPGSLMTYITAIPV
ncbi:S-adenosyl-L-methionine-dependent methyltransferase [Pilatotrama ljubarskyi]|nr:S-adenosyl-L-methionine-dependent methyltransferase [Pilatotrama ljubarskyi]